ncbi:hypothetical protein MRQ36_10920 [Micromonospora sp. R77]|uniref:hypothetical protein n=1 Tax=Micromonospora sp. R77 TaxID=2925836 RepID=UPI001F6020C4|nr:hypothetical protein [Micromonospora sp. R77]MCI4063061.1 hypothetical protein [Micromonospora sp. R77]
MPPQPHRPAELAGQVFRGSDAIRRGLLTRHQLRGASWLRLRQDVYADARLDRDHHLACRAALLRLPPGALIAGPSAAHLHGVGDAARFDDEVHVLVSGSARVDPQTGIRVHRFTPDLVGGRNGRSPARPPADGVGESGPLRTGPAECAWETAVWSDPFRAVAIVDALLGRGLVRRDELAEVADRRAGRSGGRRAGWIFGLADPASGSSAESHLRVGLVLAGLPRPVARHPVRLGPDLVLHPELAWPEFHVAIECGDRRRAVADHPGLARLADAGWLVLSVASRRLHREFPAVQAQVLAALRARGWRRR